MEAVMLVATGMLVFAAISDLAIRRVRNLVWIPFLAAAVPVQITAFVEHGWWPLAAAATINLAAYILWRFGLLYGGADAKAIMVLAWLAPVYGEANRLQLLPAVDTLLNAQILTLAYPLVLFAVNAAQGTFHPLMAFGRPMDVAEAKARKVFPMHHVDEGQLKTRLLARRGDDPLEVYRWCEANGVAKVWTTPKIPFMVPLLFGFLAAWVWGNALIFVMLA